MDVPKSEFQDAAGAKVHFLEHPLEQTFSSSGSGEAQKADSGSDRNDKKTFFVCFADVTKTHWPWPVIQNQCLRKTLINSQKKLKANY